MATKGAETVTANNPFFPPIQTPETIPPAEITKNHQANPSFRKRAPCSLKTFSSNKAPQVGHFTLNRAFPCCGTAKVCCQVLWRVIAMLPKPRLRKSLSRNMHPSVIQIVREVGSCILTVQRLFEAGSKTFSKSVDHRLSENHFSGPPIGQRWIGGLEVSSTRHAQTSKALFPPPTRPIGPR